MKERHPEVPSAICCKGLLVAKGQMELGCQAEMELHCMWWFMFYFLWDLQKGAELNPNRQHYRVWVLLWNCLSLLKYWIISHDVIKSWVMEINEATHSCAWFCLAGEIFLSVIIFFFRLFVFYYSARALWRVSSEDLKEEWKREAVLMKWMGGMMTMSKIVFKVPILTSQWTNCVDDCFQIALLKAPLLYECKTAECQRFNVSAGWWNNCTSALLSYRQEKHTHSI